MLKLEVLDTIFEIFGSWWPHGSQDASGGSFCTFPCLGGQVVFRMSLEDDFDHFWVVVAQLFSECFWMLIYDTFVS